MDDGDCTFVISGVDGDETVVVAMLFTTDSDDPHVRYRIKIKDLYLLLRKVLTEPDMLCAARDLDGSQDPPA